MSTKETPHMEDKLDIILAAIEKSRVYMESTISSLPQDFNVLRDKHGKLRDRVKNTEQALTDLEPSSAAATTYRT